MSTPPRSQTPEQVRRNRRLLLAIAALFFGSLVLAGILRFSGWHPPATRAHGELLQPPADLRRITPVESNGTPYRWEPAQRTWRIALAPPAECAQACVKLGQQLLTVWQLMGPDAEHLQVLWIGEPPQEIPRGGALHVLRADDALRAGLPRLHPVAGESLQGVPVYVIDPNGFVVLRYAPGFDPAGLRADLSKLLKLM
jgi:hypothetical protein